MKPTFFTLVGLLAASVAANPVPSTGGAALAIRGNGNNGANADAGKQAGQNSATGKGKQNGKKGGNQGGGATNGTANAGNAAAGGAGAGAGGAGAGAKAGNASALVLPDGRIKQDATPESFNVLESVFKSAVVKGDGKSANSRQLRYMADSVTRSQIQ